MYLVNYMLQKYKRIIIFLPDVASHFGYCI